VRLRENECLFECVCGSVSVCLCVCVQSSSLQINFLSDNSAGIKTALPDINFLWPVNAFVGTGSSEYENIMLLVPLWTEGSDRLQ
jgi:hypothetical protein